MGLQGWVWGLVMGLQGWLLGLAMGLQGWVWVTLCSLGLLEQNPQLFRRKLLGFWKVSVDSIILKLYLLHSLRSEKKNKKETLKLFAPILGILKQFGLETHPAK